MNQISKEKALTKARARINAFIVQHPNYEWAVRHIKWMKRHWSEIQIADYLVSKGCVK
jgi:hypothetical protein